MKKRGREKKNENAVKNAAERVHREPLLKGIVQTYISTGTIFENGHFILYSHSNKP